MHIPPLLKEKGAKEGKEKEREVEGLKRVGKRTTGKEERRKLRERKERGKGK